MNIEFDRTSLRTIIVILSDKEKIVIAAIQGDIPVCDRPYSILAETTGLSEEEFIRILSGLNEKGIIRRFGATLKHQKSGFASNAMVAWKTEEASIAETGRAMASSRAVSHCYRRSPQKSWDYNLYTMVHAVNENECLQKVKNLSDLSGVSNFEILFSIRELKKTSMKYFGQTQTPQLSMVDDDD